MKNIINYMLAIALLISATMFVSHNQTTEACEEAPQSYDLTVIDNWCGAGTERGSIRFVGAEVESRNGDNITLLDEQGNLWEVEHMNIDDNDFLLLWINDTDTYDNFSDDVIIKVWREAY